MLIQQTIMLIDDFLNGFKIINNQKYFLKSRQV